MHIHSLLKKIASIHVNKNSFILQLLLLPLSFNLIAQQTTNNAGNKTIALFQAIRSGSTAALQKQLAGGSIANDSLNSYSALMAAALTQLVACKTIHLKIH